MDKFKIDYTEVANSLKPITKIAVSQVSDKLEKVGFGVVRYNEGNKSSLWEIKDGHIYALYDQEDSIEKQSNDWSVEPDKTGKFATVFYKDTAVKNIKFADYGVEPGDIRTFAKMLPERLANNTELVKKMLDSLDDNYKARLLEIHPELV